ncbi:hypothetical protein AAFN90_02955 [Erwiniaceae bacterium CAU 1747]
MFTRSTLTVIVAAGILAGCAPHSSGTAPVSSVDEGSPAGVQASGMYMNTTYIQDQHASATEISGAEAAHSAAVSAVKAPVTQADDAAIQTQSTTSTTAPTQHAVAADGTGVQTAATATGGQTPAASADSSAVQASATAATATGGQTPAASVDSSAVQATAANAATATASAVPADNAATEITSIKTPIIPAVTTAPQAQSESAQKPAAQSEVHVYHALTRTDDGSSIIVTVDGKEMGVLKRGEMTSLSVAPGKHKLGGYVRTLFGLGRVTIPALDITTSSKSVTKISYAVTKEKPGFSLINKGRS